MRWEAAGNAAPGQPRGHQGAQATHTSQCLYTLSPDRHFVSRVQYSVQ